MASTPQYGGDGTVPDLNIGQKGSALFTANQAHYRVRMHFGQEEKASVFNPIPRQAAVFEDVPGPVGTFYRWHGSLVADTVARIQGILDLCFQLKKGHTRSAGVIGGFNANNIQETVLKDEWGNTLSTRARLFDFSLDQEINKLYGNPTFSYITRLTVVFRTLP